MTPLPAREALDRHFLEMRAKLLEVAACLDRIDRGGGAKDDPRLAQLGQAISLLQAPTEGRAERLQLLFSLPYDAAWRSKMQIETRT